MFKIGLIAGVGNLPCEFAKVAKNYGFQVVAIAVVEDYEKSLQEHVSVLYQAHIGELDSIINLFKQEQVFAVTMIGKVTKEHLFNGSVRPDMRALKLLQSLPNQNDDTIMLALVQELASEGIRVMDQSKLLTGLMPKAGVLTERKPTEQEQADIDYGYEMALRIGQLDIGQTVVVKNKAIMAVEAIEGTDACILRGGKLARGNAVVAKTAKPAQDNRFDIPCVGVQTIEAMIEAEARVLVMQAEKTLFVDQTSVLKLANEHNICIVVK